MLRTHVPEPGRHQHPICWSAEEMFVTVRLPPLIEPRSDLLRTLRHELLPVIDVLNVAGESGHRDQGFRHFKMI
jgi:hypothetical protein